MLTGDAEAVAGNAARKLELNEYFAEVLPNEKAYKVKQVKREGGLVAIGAGTDVAIESADIVLVKNDPRDVVAILDLSGAAYRKMMQNFALATGYNIIAIPLAAGIAVPWGIVLSPAVGAALMSASTVLAAINAKLLERAKGLVRHPSDRTGARHA
jgi:Cu2+-exporting ATPase